MYILKVSVAILLTAATLATGSLVVSQKSLADSIGATLAPSSLKTTIINRAITADEVLAAQRAWGEALVAISTTSDTKGKAAAKALAEKVIDEAYAYQFGAVLFKPTQAAAPQSFRTTRAGALSYFVGGDPTFPMDTGFALKHWRKVEIKNAAIFISGNTATTMGNVMFTNKEGKVTTVDKTWQFFKDDSGKIRIILHHSSLPYVAQ